jgi:ABC-type ATPase involved in cell division
VIAIWPIGFWAWCSTPRPYIPADGARSQLLCLAQSNGIPVRRVEEVLGLAGLQSAAGRRAGGFSLGMSQRLGIAAALLGDPEVLMFDEPVNGLGPEGIVWARQLMGGLAAEGRTVLVSSHLMSEMALSDVGMQAMRCCAARRVGVEATHDGTGFCACLALC